MSLRSFFIISLMQDLSSVAKLLTPSVRCPVCSYATNQDFRFCQYCGYEQKVHMMVSVHRIAIDLEKIDQCLQRLMNFNHATGYAKQKDSLKKS